MNKTTLTLTEKSSRYSISFSLVYSSFTSGKFSYFTSMMGGSIMCNVRWSSAALSGDKWCLIHGSSASILTNVTLLTYFATSDELLDKTHTAGYTQWGRKKQFYFVCIFFNTWQKLAIFFTYIGESISYNSMYLIWHALRTLHINENETINTSR